MDKIKASAVNFNPVKGDKRANIDKMRGFIENAEAEGSNIIVFPELCTTGYDFFTDDTLSVGERIGQCENIEGSTINLFAEIAEKNNMYIVYGFGELKGEEIYNSCAVLSPIGERYIYRKIHLFGNEGSFFKGGDAPLIFDTPWGKTAVGICFDTYSCPELLRYYASKGVRLYLNPTAMALEDGEGAKESFCSYYKVCLDYSVINTGMFIISSNLTGIEDISHFGGGSVIMGVGKSQLKRPRVEYYAGDIYSEEEGVFTSEIDLSLVNKRLFIPDKTGNIAYKPEIYSKLYK